MQVHSGLFQRTDDFFFIKPAQKQSVINGFSAVQKGALYYFFKKRPGVLFHRRLVGAGKADHRPTHLKALLAQLDAQYPFIDSSKKMILVTGHRRESFGGGFERICHALAEIATTHPEVQIIYPVHLNPNVQKPVKELLGSKERIHLIDPMEYAPFSTLMKESHIIMTDSGGVQEEAPSLGKPVIVLRSTTERPEAVEYGTVKLAGTDKETIVNEVQKLLDDEQEYKKMSEAINPYGDGLASKRIVEIIKKNFLKS